MHIDELETPAAIVDLDRLEANINKYQSYLNEHTVNNRPHIKTHKIPAIAQMQLDAGAAGITCQKIGEAEVMAEAGIRDIFIPYNILGAAKLSRLMALAKRASLSVTADSDVTVEGLSAAASSANLTLNVLVEFDTGLGRCGVQTPPQAADLARLIDQMPGLTFGGLMTYPVNATTDEMVAEATALLGKSGLEVVCVSTGGTPPMWEVHQHGLITEHRAGTYAYGDRKTVFVDKVQTLEEVAFRVITTVVSRPTPDRGILDGGSKTFSSDRQGGFDDYGLILEYSDAVIHSQSEEHGWVDFSRCAAKPGIGERVSVVPNHVCVVSNLFNEVAAVRGDTVEVVWPVAGRGKLV